MINWNDCSKDFLSDGSLRDIYILKITMDNWQELLTFIRANYKVSFSLDSKQFNFTGTAVELFQFKEKSNVQMNFSVEGIEMACHFFSVEEIEFDFLPQDIKGQQELNSVLMFIKKIGDLLGKDVLITPENYQKSPIAKYSQEEKSYKHYPANSIT